MANKSFSPDQKTYIIEAYKQGISPKDIADKLGVWNNSITRFLRKNDIERNQLKRLPEETIQTIITRYGQGISSEVIAKDLGINGSTVCRQLKKHGIEIRPSTENKRKPKNVPMPDKYGTTYIPEFNGKCLTKDVIRAMTQEERDEAAKFLVSFYRQHGFPYPILTDEKLLHEFAALKNTDVNTILDGNIIRPFNNIGVPIFKHFSPHYYEVNGRGAHPSLLDTFKDDARLLKVIHNRFTQDGGYNMTGNMLKQGLCNSKIGYKASIFFPLVAKLVYSRHLKDGDIAYDYSMGFGQRLLGFLSLPFSGVYVGVDPVKKTVEANKSIFNFYNERVSGLNKTVDLICSGSESYTGEKYAGRVSLAFSSPPYFDLERYEDSDTQAYSKGYISFISSWWKDTVAHITRMLKPGGLFIMNIKDQYEQLNLGSDMTEFIEKAGYNRLEGYKMQITRNTRYLRKDGQHKYEPFYVFQKPA